MVPIFGFAETDIEEKKLFNCPYRIYNIDERPFRRG